MVTAGKAVAATVEAVVDEATETAGDGAAKTAVDEAAIDEAAETAVDEATEAAVDEAAEVAVDEAAAVVDWSYFFEAAVEAATGNRNGRAGCRAVGAGHGGKGSSNGGST